MWVEFVVLGSRPFFKGFSPFSFVIGQEKINRNLLISSSNTEVNLIFMNECQ